MKKKCLSCLFAALLLFTAVIPGIALADFNYDTIGTPHIIVIDASDLSASSPVYERAADEQIYPASTTKMLTCLLALEHASLDTEITVGEEIRGFFETKKGYTTGPSGSSLMGLVVGETVTLRDLLYGLMLTSGNDAADAIAVAIGGTIQDFVNMMNKRVKDLGLKNTSFKNPHGLTASGHYTTASDLALIALELVKHKKCPILKRHCFGFSYENHLMTSNGMLLDEEMIEKKVKDVGARETFFNPENLRAVPLSKAISEESREDLVRLRVPGTDVVLGAVCVLGGDADGRSKAAERVAGAAAHPARI